MLIEVSDETLDLELKTSIFLDDIRIFCEKFKLSEEFIEKNFLEKANLPEKILKAIFKSQPLTLSFLIKHRNIYQDKWLLMNPNLKNDNELFEQLGLIDKLTNTEKDN